MKSTQRLNAIGREIAMSTSRLTTLSGEVEHERKAMLERAFRDALRARDAGFAAVVAAQLRQYVGVHHA